MTKKLVICFVMLTIYGCGSTGPTPLRGPVKAAIEDVQVSASRQEVFDAALVVSQYLTLNVGVLEKDSGLIRFDAALLNHYQLDKFCEYPLVNSAGRPWDTFTGWNNRSQQHGGGPVNGNLSLTILITDHPAGSNLNLRSLWRAHNRVDNYVCNSTGVFEKDFVSELKRYLNQDPAKNETAPKIDLYEELLRLDDLRKNGHITDAEFEAEKKILLESN